MNNFKFKLIPVILLILTATCLLTMAGCGGAEVSDIVITNSNQPRTTYVQGQELDLSKGSITVLTDGKESQVPLNAEGVTVSGYNKDQLGKQTLTVTYLEKSTTFEINVVARISADSYEKDYFVGDSFNSAKGKLKITNDDGTTTTVSFNSTLVSVSGFDSTAPGDKTVTVTYTDSNGKSYSTDIKVSVYKVGEITLTKPTKLSYSSHETDLDLSGGYLTVKAEGNDSLSKFVDLTKDMISGFDPAAATMENRVTPLDQTLTVTYAGKTISYKISVVYSPISIISDAVALFEGVDLKVEGAVSFTAEQSEAIFEAVKEFVGLTQAKKELLDYKVIEPLALAGTREIMTRFANEVLKNQDVFIINNDGNILLSKASIDRVKVIADMLDDSDSDFNVYCHLLRNLKEEFASFQIYGKTTINNYIVVPTAQHVNLYVEVFRLLGNLHETLKDVPENWKIDDLGAYSQNITTAVHLIVESGCAGPEFNQIYSLLSSWRAKDDFFEIIYSYYYYVAENGRDFIVSNMWLKVPLPGILQDWYLAFYTAMYQAQFMATEKAYLYDTSTFMYSYFETYRLSEEIKNSDNEFYKGIYATLNGDILMDHNIRKAAGGYLVHSNNMLNSERFMALWDNYVELLRLEASGELNIETHANIFEAIIDDLTALSPSETFGFLSSLHYLYSQSGGNQYSFDYYEKAKSKFVYYIANYMIANLPKDAAPAVQNMMIALESYAMHIIFGTESNAVEVFKNSVTSYKVIYNSLSESDAKIFDNFMGNRFKKYLNIYDSLDDSYVYNPGEWEAKLNELETLIKEFFDINIFIGDKNTTEEQRKNAVIILISVYERAHDVYYEILNSGNEAAITTLSSKPYPFDDVELSLESAFCSARITYMNYMLSITFTTTDANGNTVPYTMWDLYSKTNIDEFLKAASHVLVARFNNASLGFQNVKNAMEAFRNLSDSDKGFFSVLGSSYYYETLNLFFISVITQEFEKKYEDMSNDAIVSEKDNTIALVTALLQTEVAYTGYTSDSENEERLAAFISEMEKAIALYNSIGDTELRDLFALDAYNYYLELYTSLKAA